MTTLKAFALLTLTLVLSAALTGCATAKGGSPAEKRADVQKMRAETLNMFYARNPNVRPQLEKAAGFGVFSAVNTQTIFVASGNGFGVIRDNKTGQDTYMRAFKLGGGLGAGVADVRAVVIFHDAKAMYDVLEHGWGVSGKADAIAKVGESGDAGSLVVTLPGMSIYRFTNNGVLVGGAIEGAKVWKDTELN